MQYSVKFVENFTVKQFKNSTHKILILGRIEKMVSVVLFCLTRLDFQNHNLNALNILFKKVVLPGRVKCGVREGAIVVAHGPLPSLARSIWKKQPQISL